jgi:glycerol kinase
MADHVLAIDQGTTSTRAIVFGADGQPRASAQRELPQIFPQPGWVEHDAEEIWAASVAVSREAIADAGVEPAEIGGIGITNQRETAVIWERASGKPIHNAIVWQDRRTADFCAELRAGGYGELIAARTGLLPDPYFSGTKIRWLLDHVEGAREKAAAGDLAFGTIESFLLWRLTGGRVHATDASNASRTLLYDLRRNEWDAELCELIGVPMALLPEVVDNAGEFGTSEAGILGAAIPVRGMAGDQQAATFGQCCFQPGMMKSTYGTGCFALLNTGSEAVASSNRLLTTIAYRLQGTTTYALEGSIFMAGAAVQWLRDGLHLFDDAGETAILAAQAHDESDVYMVPAFTGLGAPYWDAEARGALLGLTRDTGIAEVVRATLDAVCYQTRDLMEAMLADAPTTARVLRVDGGMVVNDWVMQRLADLVGVTVDRPQFTETTALGAAYLAGMQAGVFGGLDELAGLWQRDAAFEPALDAAARDIAYAGWQDAVRRVRSDRDGTPT